MKTTRLDTSNEVPDTTSPWPIELPTTEGTTTEVYNTMFAPVVNTTDTSLINPCTVDTNCAPNEHCKLGHCRKKGTLSLYVKCTPLWDFILLID